MTKMLDEPVEAARRWYEKTEMPPLLSGLPRSILVDCGEISDVVKKMKKLVAQCESRAKLGGRPDPRWHFIGMMLEECGEKIAACCLGDPLGFIDGLMDCIYVDVGAGYHFNMDVSGAYAEVVRSNDSKQFNGDKRVHDKGPNYSPPQLERFIR